jgi:hypothetical protein
VRNNNKERISWHCTRIFRYFPVDPDKARVMLKRPVQSSPESFVSPPVPLDQCLAKSRKTDEGTTLPGRLVFSHCQIVGEVARAMMSRMPDWLRAELFPAGAELIAAAHDIGKVSPTFQKKIYTALSRKDEAVLSSLRAHNAGEGMAASARQQRKPGMPGNIFLKSWVSTTASHQI